MSDELPIDASCQAEYEDGFILDETAQHDRSAYLPTPLVDGVPTGPNTLSDIINHRPEPEHGKLVRFTVFYKDRRYDIDWTTLVDNARPIRYKNIEQDSIGGQIIETRVVGVGFGYQYKDENGKNIQEVQNL